MNRDFSKGDRKRIRALAELAWGRMLRQEFMAIRDSIDSMEQGDVSPFEVSDVIHRFHNGVSRELYSQFSESVPWFGVCSAYLGGVLTDEDFVCASERIHKQLERHVEVSKQLASRRDNVDE